MDETQVGFESMIPWLRETDTLATRPPLPFFFNSNKLNCKVCEKAVCLNEGLNRGI
jgi:hypothetical protein